jgi:lysine 6-dehydrogenase
LLNNPAVSHVVLADVRVGALPAFLTPFVGPRLEAIALDVRDVDAVRAVFSRCDAVMSAIPYYFNAALAAIAVDVGVHFADLGGNTQIVQEQKQLDAAAKAKGISVIPDTGLAPGMVNVIAQHGVDQFDTVESSSWVGCPRLPSHHSDIRSRTPSKGWWTTTPRRRWSSATDSRPM